MFAPGSDVTMRPNIAPVRPPGKLVCSRNAAKLPRSSLPRAVLNNRLAADPAASALSGFAAQMSLALRCKYSTSGSPRSRGWRVDCSEGASPGLALSPYTPFVNASSTVSSTSSANLFSSRSACITLRPTTLRDRMASAAPSMDARANSPSAVRQWRLRHCEDMRVRVVPPNGMRFARPLSSRFNNAAGYECSVWICRNLRSVIVSLLPIWLQ